MGRMESTESGSFTDTTVASGKALEAATETGSRAAGAGSAVTDRGRGTLVFMVVVWLVRDSGALGSVTFAVISLYFYYDFDE